MSEINSGTLYLVPTPIGNLEDITERAVETLKQADIIAAEDTRHTRILLDHLGITGHVVSTPTEPIEPAPSFIRNQRAPRPTG